MDAGTYPIAKWAVKCGLGKRTPVKLFKHHDPGELQRLLRHSRRNGLRPVVLSDGFCPGCGRTAPIREYLESIRQVGGLLILDDTQALGILGKRPGPVTPYGLGGGGSLQWSGARGSDLVVVSSMAKGFGAPLAVLAGGRGLVKRFERSSRTQVHCSPPSIAAIQAAQHAIELNERRGDELRQRLKQLVCRFRSRLKNEGLELTGRLFPVQGLAPIPGLDVHEVYERLLQMKVHTVLKRSHLGTQPQIALLFTTDHTASQIDEVAAVLSKTVRSVLSR